MGGPKLNNFGFQWFLSARILVFRDSRRHEFWFFVAPIGTNLDFPLFPSAQIFCEKLILAKKMQQQRGSGFLKDRNRALSKMHLRKREMKDERQRGLQMYLFDYNSVELVMLGSAICVCATGIMFTSGNFVGRPDLQVQRDLIAIAIILVVIVSRTEYLLFACLVLA